MIFVLTVNMALTGSWGKKFFLKFMYLCVCLINIIRFLKIFIEFELLNKVSYLLLKIYILKLKNNTI